MTGDERETLRVLVSVANRETSGRVTLTESQCRDLYRMYEAEPLYVQYDLPPEVRVALGRYGDRRRNRQMDALLITYLLRGAEGMVQLHVGRRMALGLLAMLDSGVRADALKLADRWRRQRERKGEDG